MNKRSTGELSLIIFSYLAVFTVWSTTFLFIAYAVETIPASWILAIRFSLCGLMLIALAWIKGDIKQWPDWKQLLSAMLLGLLLLVLGNGLVTYAEKTVDSYKAALIMTTAPLIVAFFNRIFYRQPLVWPHILGAVFGLAGVAFILYKGPENSKISLEPALILVFIGILSWAMGMSISRKLSAPSSPFLSTGIQMCFAGVFALAAALITRGNPLPILKAASQRSLFALVYLTVIGGLTIVAFNYLLKKEPSGRISVHTLINPTLATILGLWIRKEEPVPLLFIGLPLILLSVTMILYSKKIEQLGKDILNRKRKLKTGSE